MSYLAYIGVAVAAAVGVTLAAGGFAAMVVGGIVVGAVVGGLYSAFTGGNILKGVLWGAVGGAAIGAGAAAAGFGLTSSTVTGTEAAFAGSGYTGLGAVGDTTVGGLSATLGDATVSTSVSGGVLAAPEVGGGLFTAANVTALTGVASLGGSFIKSFKEGEAAEETLKTKIAAEAKIASEKNATDRAIAAEGHGATMGAAMLQYQAAAERNSSAEKMAANELDFGKSKYAKDFEEAVFRDRTDREDKRTAKQKFEAGINEASQYVAGKTETATLADANKRRRDLPTPSWSKPETPPIAPKVADAPTSNTAPTSILGAA